MKGPLGTAADAAARLVSPPQIASLKALGLNIRRAKIETGNEHKFYVTDARTSEKVGADGRWRWRVLAGVAGRRRCRLQAADAWLCGSRAGDESPRCKRRLDACRPCHHLPTIL